jgi:hypothetical protein
MHPGGDLAFAVLGKSLCAVTSVAQAFFFAVFAYILLYRPKKTLRGGQPVLESFA